MCCCSLCNPLSLYRRKSRCVLLPFDFYFVFFISCFLLPASSSFLHRRKSIIFIFCKKKRAKDSYSLIRDWKVLFRSIVEFWSIEWMCVWAAIVPVRQIIRDISSPFRFVLGLRTILLSHWKEKHIATAKSKAK